MRGPMGGNGCFSVSTSGSASVRAGLYDRHGRRLAFAVRPIRQFHPRAGFVEQSSADIWTADLRGRARSRRAGRRRRRRGGRDRLRRHLLAGRRGRRRRAGLGGRGRRSRSATSSCGWTTAPRDETAAINATRDPALAYVGGEVSIEMELPKVLWLRRHFPDRYAATRRFFDLADYLVWRCCGADAASVCTLTCKWNYLAHEDRFPSAMLRAVGPRRPRRPSCRSGSCRWARRPAR